MVEIFLLESCRTPFYTIQESDVGCKLCVLVVPVLQTIDGSTALGRAAYSLTEVIRSAEVCTLHYPAASHSSDKKRREESNRVVSRLPCSGASAVHKGHSVDGPLTLVRSLS